MLGEIRSVPVLALVVALTWGCAGERITTSQATEPEDPGTQPLGKLAVRGNLAQAVVLARVKQGQTPVSGVTVELARSISGRRVDYAWSGTTNARGRARLKIGGAQVTGYYRARVVRSGSVVGSWSSIPINSGYEVQLELPIGARAHVTGSTRLTPEGLPVEIAIGVVLPLATPRGLEIRNGFELARKEINGSSKLGGASIEFIIEDSRRSVESVVEAFNKLIHQDGVPAILGPTLSTEAEEVFPIAQQSQVVAFSSTSSASGLSAIGDYIFRAGLNVNVLVPGPVRETQEKLGYRRVATIVDEIDVFSRSSDEAIRNTLAEIGVDVVARETFKTRDSTFTDQLTRIEALNPDAIFISALSAEQSEILIQGRQVGISTDVPFITLEMTKEEVRVAGAAAEGAITFTGWTRLAATPGNQAFIDDYEAKYSIDASRRSAQSYAALHILAEAIARAQSTDSRAIRDAMADIRDLDTILGRFSFDADGDAVYDPIVLIVRDGELEVFE